ncbi:DeoR/GlpR family DNA-binding transcription regulator [Pseudotabrizicola formosa]|uniref:DeoR/GlpR family DNA-binding transcription regulator n=1 Tax=Pseudotabrizicola formosa TaxID=2030009 RepID=UPI000CD04015|nr:DeoR/GlpR family DNA-binding transcription regulator [Pseudotabrizicola formosa]
MDGLEDKKALRQQRLLQRLTLDRHLTLDEIAQHFAVTTQTARRDVMELSQRGYLRRVPGGAMVIDGVGAGTLRDRRIANRAAKERIAVRVAAEIPDGSAIFLDTGTTCEAIARALVGAKDLRVVTYSLRIAAFLADQTSFILALPGGFVRLVDGAVFQESTAAFLSGFRFDLAILSVTGVEASGELTNDDPAEVTVVRAAMAQAQRTYLAVDHSKFGNRGLVQMGNLSEISCVISDRPPPDEVAMRIAASGGRVLIG